jgi:hypothetical protein
MGDTTVPVPPLLRNPERRDSVVCGLRGIGRRDEGKTAALMHPGREVRTENHARSHIGTLKDSSVGYSFAGRFFLKQFVCQEKSFTWQFTQANVNKQLAKTMLLAARKR